MLWLQVYLNPNLQAEFPHLNGCLSLSLGKGVHGRVSFLWQTRGDYLDIYSPSGLFHCFTLPVCVPVYLSVCFVCWPGLPTWSLCLSVIWLSTCLSAQLSPVQNPVQMFDEKRIGQQDRLTIKMLKPNMLLIRCSMHPCVCVHVHVCSIYSTYILMLVISISI